MRVAEFEKALRKGIVFEEFHMLNSDVLSVDGNVTGEDGETIRGVWDDKGKFFAFAHQPSDEKMNLVIVHPAVGVYASWNGYTLVRTPWFDIKFE